MGTKVVITLKRELGVSDKDTIFSRYRFDLPPEEQELLELFWMEAASLGARREPVQENPQTLILNYISTSDLRDWQALFDSPVGQTFTKRYAEYYSKRGIDSNIKVEPYDNKTT